MPANGGQSGDEGHKTGQRPVTPTVPSVGQTSVVTTELDVAEFEFRGQPLSDFLADFGGERAARWLPAFDANYPSVLTPSPGLTTVSLTVDGLPTNLLELTQPEGIVSYKFSLPLRLQTADGALDVSFVASVGLLQSGEMRISHELSGAQLGEVVELQLPEGHVGDVSYSLGARIWPGGSAGALRASLPRDAGLTPALPSGPLLQVAAPPVPVPPPGPPPVPPPAGWPEPWAAVDSPGTLLAWPNGEACNGATGRDYALNGLTPDALLDLVSLADGLTLTQNGATSDAGASAFTVEVVSGAADVCVSTKAWRGSALDRLSVTANVHVTDEQSGLDLTLPVEIVALHEAGVVDTVYFASSLDWWTWAPGGASPLITGVNLEARTGLTGAANSDTVFPLLTGRIRPLAEGVEADGQILVAVPALDEGDAVGSVTDLNLAEADESEVETLFYRLDYKGVEQVLLDGVWSTGGSEP